MSPILSLSCPLSCACAAVAARPITALAASTTNLFDITQTPPERMTRAHRSLAPACRPGREMPCARARFYGEYPQCEALSRRQTVPSARAPRWPASSHPLGLRVWSAIRAQRTLRESCVGDQLKFVLDETHIP